MLAHFEFTRFSTFSTTESRVKYLNQQNDSDIDSIEYMSDVPTKKKPRKNNRQKKYY